LLGISPLPNNAYTYDTYRWGLICRVSCESIFQARLFSDTQEVKRESAVFRPFSPLSRTRESGELGNPEKPGKPGNLGNLRNLACSTYLSVDYEDYVLFEVKLSEIGGNGELGNFENVTDDWRRTATVSVREVEPVYA
jgi:hypothetical protein